MRYLKAPALLLLPVILLACEGGPLDTVSTVEPSFVMHGAEVEQPITGTMALTAILDPGTQSVTPGGVTLQRGLIVAVEIAGDVAGEITFAQSANLNEQGNGGVNGPFDGEATWAGLTGGLSGTAAFNVRAFFVTGTFVGHGTGELAGHKLTFNLEGPFGGPFSYSGNVVSPATGG